MATIKDKDEVSKTAIVHRLVLDTEYRTKQDINSWRNAMAEAENKVMPSRGSLYRLYNEIVLDCHVQGLIQQRINRLLSKPFRVVNAQGEEVSEATALFKTKWFYQFLELLMESRFWGHSLIQLWDVREQGYGSVQLVPRMHVLPDLGAVTIKQGDQTSTIPFRESPYYDWLVEVGGQSDFGLFQKAAPAFILKKYAQLHWSQYEEIFGMPVRKGTTRSTTQKDLNNMGDRLRKMGSAPYIVLQEGEEVEFIESTKGDAHKVFSEMIALQNKELSKLVMGQTMTTEDGSSRSQGEVHERIADTIAEADDRMASFSINDDLFPRMIKHGFKLSGLRFEWVPVKDMAQLFEQTIKLMTHKQVPNQFIEDNFGIEVADKVGADNDNEGGKEVDKEGNPKPAKKPVRKPKAKQKEEDEELSVAKIDLVNLHVKLHEIYNHPHSHA